MSLIKRGQVLSQPPGYGRIGVTNDSPPRADNAVTGALIALQSAKADRRNRVRATPFDKAASARLAK